MEDTAVEEDEPEEPKEVNFQIFIYLRFSNLENFKNFCK